MVSTLTVRARLASAMLGLPVLASTPLAAAGAEAQGTAMAARPIQRTVSARLKDVPMREAVASIEQAAGVRIRPMWAERGMSGLDPDMLVDLDFKAVAPLRAVDLLARACAGAEADAPTWQAAEDGAIEIGPRSRLNATKTTVVYDIKDLVAVVPNFKDAPTIDLAAALSRAGGTPLREVSTDRAGFGYPDADPVEQLMDLIADLVEPEQWSQHGGAAATMRRFQGQIIITAPGYIHRQLR